MIEFLSDIDTQLLLFFNGIHSPFWDYFMSAFTGKVIWVPMYASILYILLKNFHWKVALCYVVAIALTITFADQMCNSFPSSAGRSPASLQSGKSDSGFGLYCEWKTRREEFGFPSCQCCQFLSDLPIFLICLFRKRWVKHIYRTLGIYQLLYTPVPGIALSR